MAMNLMEREYRMMEQRLLAGLYLNYHNLQQENQNQRFTTQPSFSASTNSATNSISDKDNSTDANMSVVANW